jgi:hypothetical protein
MGRIQGIVIAVGGAEAREQLKKSQRSWQHVRKGPSSFTKFRTEMREGRLT